MTGDEADRHLEQILDPYWDGQDMDADILLVEPFDPSIVKKTGAYMPKKKKKEFNLNLEPLPKAEGIEELAMLLYGYEKIGKTSLANEFEKPYFLFTEPGHKSLSGEVYGTLVDTWPVFKTAVSQLLKTRKFKTIVIDTIDIAYDLCLDHVCQKKGIEHPGDEGYGKGWNAVNKEFARPLRRLMQKKGVVFISHAKEADFQSESGTRNRVVPTMSGSCAKIINPAVDVWALYKYGPEGRQIIIRGNASQAAGTRLGDNFLAPDGSQLSSIPAGRSASEAYVNFMKAYRNELEVDTIDRKKKKKKKRRPG